MRDRSCALDERAHAVVVDEAPHGERAADGLFQRLRIGGRRPAQRHRLEPRTQLRVFRRPLEEELDERFPAPRAEVAAQRRELVLRRSAVVQPGEPARIRALAGESCESRLGDEASQRVLFEPLVRA